ncbi:MAG: hypothetical protein UR39_C0010G0049 [Candidatus Woesebacteria bacterium GW2011_GWA1_33_30]|uniref:Uncharacterized protein n=1 Tax=Candidatus Woesebacteria bacterium GW2011_GWA2_33_28 TaxID=1618561 RepID=A0A0G0CT95_9BACT|nr:MAG: hypothetical protein UR38_C0010G0048 [Candidatus Woesebacteria bacterium GW2011_GWA2_33_28]KKP47307.1 MAG: hypothetical protein UR39_C0010G0049 [Candidatus Woesebacteria bacterium GW2011_GWA1_33_30]KKP48952.1 MAG: hypothetical protein UR40_C0011G0048 [Microgenomates group bacterium GW2011_GWC1_33_32]KKP51490.1 MAG: hypothetical protein UR44_C0010G0048 [Candidatus Woesebacteria bacterium GW2011_GWB1_33_38]
MKNKQIQVILKGLEGLIRMKKKYPHIKFGLSDDDLAIYDTEAWYKLHSKDKENKQKGVE